MKKFIALCFAFTALLLSFTFTACKEEKPEDLPSDFYNAENWERMTTMDGTLDDVGEKPTSLDDGSIKFFNSNQAYLLDGLTNELTFMLNTTKDWQIWLKGSTKDNTVNDCYKLFYKDDVLSLMTSKNDKVLAFTAAEDCGYKPLEWNKIKVTFFKNSALRVISLFINDQKVDFPFVDEIATVNEDGDLAVEEAAGFTLGDYFAVKVWGGNCILRLKPVENEIATETLKIACIGDSITYGANADNSYTDAYPVILQNLYGKNASVINFGNSGKTIRDSADDPYRKTLEYQGISLYKPDIAVIMLGTNDSKTYQVPTKSEMVNAYKKLIEDLKEINPVMEIYMATCPYAFSSAYQINNKNIETIVIPAIKEVAQLYELKVIDMHEYTKDYSHLYADGIHPNTKGYSYLAYRFYCELEGVTPDETYIATFQNKA